MAHTDGKRTPQRKLRDQQRKQARAQKFLDARAARAAMLGGIK